VGQRVSTVTPPALPAPPPVPTRSTVTAHIRVEVAASGRVPRGAMVVKSWEFGTRLGTVCFCTIWERLSSRRSCSPTAARLRASCSTIDPCSPGQSPSVTIPTDRHIDEACEGVSHLQYLSLRPGWSPAEPCGFALARGVSVVLSRCALLPACPGYMLNFRVRARLAHLCRRVGGPPVVQGCRRRTTLPPARLLLAMRCAFTAASSLAWPQPPSPDRAWHKWPR